MSRTVLIIPDKFKGTLTAQQAARAIAQGWHRACPGDRLELSPMSDGGDGFGAILSAALNAAPRTTKTFDAAGRPCRVSWWFQSLQRAAILESARVIGLAMLPPAKYHPFQLDTAGLGHLLTAVARRDCSTCLLGIGGSATNDGGFGLARAWGWRFLDRNGRSIERWPDLVRLCKLLPPDVKPPFDIVVATDVRNLLLGPQGASKIYGPQKGLRPQDQPTTEAALRRLATVAREHFGIDHATRPGAGAAGGLGFGLMAFMNARPEAGFDLFARYSRLEDQLDRADLVITGEGAVDKSSLMGKGVGEIARHCRQRNLPCIALGGVTRDLPRLRCGFTRIAALTDLTTATEALSHPARWLTRLTEQMATSVRCA